MKDEQKREKDDVLDEVMKKYDAVHASCMNVSKLCYIIVESWGIQVEQQLAEKNRQLHKTEHELKRLKEGNSDLENALLRIDGMPELANGKRRSRSASPSTVDAADVMRKIRVALSGQKDAIREAEEAKDKAESEGRRLKRDLEALEREVKEKREATKQKSEAQELKDIKIKELEGELRRMNDRLTMLMEEKESREKVMMQLQDNITNLHRWERVSRIY